MSGCEIPSPSTIVRPCGMRVLPDFNLANNDNYGNKLRNIGVSFASLNYIGISNPSAAAPNYSGVINTGLDLSVVPGFRAAIRGLLAHAELDARERWNYVAPDSLSRLCWEVARRAAGHRGVRVGGDAGP